MVGGAHCARPRPRSGRRAVSPAQRDPRAVGAGGGPFKKKKMVLSLVVLALAFIFGWGWSQRFKKAYL